MFKAHFENLTHMVVRQSIIDILPVAAIDDEVCIPQRAELMRNCGLGHVQQRREVANAKLVFIQRPHDLGARAVAEHFEKVRKVVKLALFRHVSLDQIDHIRMDDVAIAHIIFSCH